MYTREEDYILSTRRRDDLKPLYFNEETYEKIIDMSYFEELIIFAFTI